MQVNKLNRKKKYYFLATLMLLVISCTESYNTSKSNDSEKKKSSIIDSVITLNKLPASRPIYESNKQDLEIGIQKNLEPSLKESGYSFYEYSFDTIFNQTPVLFYFHCIGGENKKAVESRFLNEMNEQYNDIYEIAMEENHGLMYLIVSDSLEISDNVLNYSRYYECNLGGQALSWTEYYKLNSDDFYPIINSQDCGKPDCLELKKHRSKTAYW